ncbi:hypothetical protein ABJB52_08700, partial [Bifidobacterium bifidum]|nr:hypothetical protein [Bifidobacterium bifidum]
MAKGAGCTPEFRAKAVGLLTESRGSCSSETRAVDQVAGDPGVAPETLRRWSDKTVFCQVVIGQCGVSFPSEKAVGFSP